jgi:hypothetical protein
MAPSTASKKMKVKKPGFGASTSIEKDSEMKVASDTWANRPKRTEASAPIDNSGLRKAEEITRWIRNILLPESIKKVEKLPTCA